MLIERFTLMLSPLATNQSHRIDIEQKGCRASLRSRFRIEKTCAFPNESSNECSFAGCLWSRYPKSVAGLFVVVSVSNMVGLYELYLALPPLTGAEKLYSCDTHFWFRSTPGYLLSGGLRRAGSSRISRRGVAQ